MVSLDESIIARLESHGERFEVLIDTKVFKMLKEGQDVDLSEHMAVEEIFSNASKGTRPTEASLIEVFGTTDTLDVARAIIFKGDVQLTAEQRREMQESKRRRIIAEIARNSINPQTKSPHPPARIEAAMEEAGVHVDPFKPVDAQVKTTLDKLRPLIPIRFETSRVAVRLKGEDYGRCYEDLVHYGKITREEWQENGAWIGVMEIPAGVRDEMLSKLKDRTRGNAQLKLL